MFTDRYSYSTGVEFFSMETPGYFIDYIPGEKNSLVITFENAHQDNLPRPNKLRHPWGAKFLHGLGYSVLGIKPKRVDWYRGRDLHEFFHSRDFSTFTFSFKEVFFYGSSMGAYGALAFSSSCAGSTVIAISPQSTLHERIVPWETRFVRGREQDWSGYFSDAAKEILVAKKVYIAYDPFHKSDRLHIDRMLSHNVILFKMPAVGHVVSNWMAQAGILKDFVAGALDGTLTAQKCHRLSRARKNLPQYYTTLGLCRTSANVAASCLKRLLDIELSGSVKLLPDQLDGVCRLFCRSKDISFLNNDLFLELLSRMSDNQVLAVLRCASENGNVEKSLSLTVSFLGEGRRGWKLFAHAAECEMKLGNLEAAVQFAKNAVNLAPHEAKPRRILSRILFSMKDYHGAIQHGKTATSLDSSNFLGWLDLSSFQIKSGNISEARKSLTQAIRINPASSLAKNRLMSISDK